jgi:hypothetical protein
VPNPHWHGAFLNDRGWYVVGWFMGLGIALGLLFLVDYRNFQRWLRKSPGGITLVRNRLRRVYGRTVAMNG